MNCQRKLFYQANPSDYTNFAESDEFLEALAEGGFQVGALARCYFSGGRSHCIDTLKPPEALRLTEEALAQPGDCVVFEAAIVHGNLLARVDVLKRVGNVIQIIEVKAKSFSGSVGANTFTTNGGGIRSEWKPYILDVAFQTYVARKVFDGKYTVDPFLMLADTDVKCSVDGLNQMFEVERIDGGDGNAKSRVRAKVSLPHLSQQHLEPQILNQVNVDDLCDLAFSESYEGRSFAERVEALARALNENEKLPPEVGSRCGKCEFRSPVSQPTSPSEGFVECFVESHEVDLHQSVAATVFDLWDNRQCGGHLECGTVLVNALRPVERVIPTDAIQGLDAAGRRQAQIHLEQQASIDGARRFFLNAEGLRSEMQTWKFPLHFIDFETTAVAIPFLKGQRPYEQIAFQFSHHIVDREGQVRHQGQFIKCERGAFPNFHFVRALRDAVAGDEGTIFCYTSHENTILNKIREQLSESDETDRDDLGAFICSIASPPGNKQEPWVPERPFVDLHKVVLRHFLDPDTKASNSLKYVLPAILNRCEFLRDKYSKPIYGAVNGIPSKNFKDMAWVRFDENGRIVNPYDLLPEIWQGDADSISKHAKHLSSIRNGGGALTAYSLLQFESVSDLDRCAMIAALLRYCELDTLAMVMLYEGLKNLAGTLKAGVFYHE